MPPAFQTQSPARGHHQEVKRHSFYLKPGEKKRVKKRWPESAAVKGPERAGLIHYWPPFRWRPLLSILIGEFIRPYRSLNQ